MDEDLKSIIPKWYESKKSYGVNMYKMGSVVVKKPTNRLI